MTLSVGTIKGGKPPSWKCSDTPTVCRRIWKLPNAETITCVVPNAFRTLELLVLSREIESGRRKYMFCRAKIGRPPVTNPHPLSVPEISISALECRVLPSETESVRGGLSGGGYGGVFDLK